MSYMIGNYFYARTTFSFQVHLSKVSSASVSLIYYLFSMARKHLHVPFIYLMPYLAPWPSRQSFQSHIIVFFKIY